MRLDELAVVAERLLAGQGVVPEEAAGGEGERVAALVGIAAREAAERLLQVVGDVGLVDPLMAVGAEHAAAIEVVEQRELAGQRVLVGRHLLAEHAPGSGRRCPPSCRRRPGRRCGSP